MKLLASLFLTLLFAPQVFAYPSRVLIIRHGEKPADKNNVHLSPRGVQRAQALTQLFLKKPQLLLFGKPVAIFAFNNFGDGSERGVETATPLAKSLGLKLNTNFGPDQTREIANIILGNPAFNNKMVFLVWRHSNLQDLAVAFGAQNAPAWDSIVFDRIWQIDFTPQGQVSSFKDIPEQLLPGDSN